MTILEEILEGKRVEVAEAMKRVSPAQMRTLAQQVAEPTRGFRRALETAPSPVVIAELKRRSPSKGTIREPFDPVALARDYAGAGAAALSILTDEPHFGGQLEFLSRVRDAVSLPLLRKDFVVDPYQLDEARAAGADAVLLIVAALRPAELGMMLHQARDLGLDALVEVHDEAELDVALGVEADLIGVNNRDLRSFDVDLAVTERLARRLPAQSGVLLVSESGIAGPRDLARLESAGAKAFLVGESLMREADVGRALRQLRRSE